ncbi:molybdopterin-guanine dinucleotide biosynthesis protein B [Psychrobacillus sp. BM2]|uniref:molybdopterin-guanine dinucleotide biosynthesis protein B n=1 Tax=Psychrobacillus sp. BM2 TaxID=3400421 RepID=UPI003B01F7EF
MEREVAVIKHHGHATGLDLPNDETDSMKFFHSGATCSIAVDNQTVQIHQQKKKWTLNQFVHLAAISNPEIIFIEGFKQEDYDKVVIIKELSEWDTLQHLTNIVCVITHGNFKIDNYLVLQIENTFQLNEWLLDWIGGDSLETI